MLGNQLDLSRSSDSKIEDMNIRKEYSLITIILVSFFTSATVGGVFGYYGGTYLFHNTPLSGFPIKSSSQNNNSGSPVTSDEATVISVVKKVSPAVVSIVATKDLTIVEQRGYSPFSQFCNDPFFQQFFGDQCMNSPSQPRAQQRTQRQQVAAGSGFVVTADGLIITNKHVVDVSQADFTVITSDGKKYPARIMAKDPIQDIALLKIDGVRLPTVTLGDSSALQIGQTVIAIGNALGEFSNTVSRGVVSGLSRSIVAGDGRSQERLEKLIQTDTAINPGNSGGPLLNLRGEVVGINTAIVQGAQNIGFTIPINEAKKDIAQVKSTGKISIPYLGIRYVLLTPELKAKNNLPVDYGAWIVAGQGEDQSAIVADSPAARAGLAERDIVLEINQARIDAAHDLSQALQKLKVGDTVTLKVLRGGTERIITLILAERK